MVKVDEAFDDGDAATEEDLVDAGDFFEVGDVGDGGGFDAEDGDFFFNAPVGEVFGDAREVGFVVGLAEAFAPVCVEEEVVSGAEG